MIDSIERKSPTEIVKMQKSGAIAASALKKVLSAVVPGITTLELDNIADQEITRLGAQASFKTVDDYKFATCINVNSGVVHGLPNTYRIQKGDVVSIDLGAYLAGFHSDLSHTVEVETTNEQKFLQVGQNALNMAIEQAKVGNRLGDISSAMQTVVESAGYSVSRELVGHGIGRELHESPFVPCYGKAGTGPKLEPGMVFALEVIYQKGEPDIYLAADRWTLCTVDGSLSGLFEHTVAISEEGPVILTKTD